MMTSAHMDLMILTLTGRLRIFSISIERKHAHSCKKEACSATVKI